MTDPVAAAIREGRLHPSEERIVRYLLDQEVAEVDEAGEDPSESWVAACLEDLPRPTYNTRPVAASASAADDAAYEALYGAAQAEPVAASADVDPEFAHLFPPTVRGRPRPVTASAGLMGEEHPLDWAIRTGRIGAHHRAEWAKRYAANPTATATTLASLYPIYAGPTAVAAAAYSTVPTALPPGHDPTLNYAEELRARQPDLIAAAEELSPAPELFPPNGDYPIATASGLPVDAVADLPWRARLVASAEPNLAKAWTLARAHGDAAAAGETAMGHIFQDQSLDQHPLVQDHVQAVHNWAMQPDFTDGEWAALFGPRA